MSDDAVLQYDAALSAAVYFDRSACGLIEVAGPEAPTFLHNLCTNDVESLPLGGGCPAFFCNVRARTLFFGTVCHLQDAGRNALWVDVEPGRAGALFQHLDKHLIAEKAELLDRSEEFTRWHVVGPTAESTLAGLLDKPVDMLAPYQHTWRTVRGIAVHVRRHDPLRLPGYDILVRKADASFVVEEIIDAGVAPAGVDAWQMLRVEAGFPEFGRDYDENRFAAEVGVPEAISYSKGCYLGQEPIVMARDRTGFVNRSLRALRLTADALPGDKLYAPDEVGLITSVAHTPGFGPIGLGYLRRGFETPDTEVHVGRADGTRARVVSRPIRA
ncbi:MAG: hypothetical protein K1X57_23090 [Gemmataceae bacterium]|nr:hypothetical protein [Gemmataceae bacterium]